MIRSSSATEAFTPAAAYWNQRKALQVCRDRIRALGAAVNHPGDLSPCQWAQLMASALEFKPDVILELGRGMGNSTCAFTEVANQLAVQGHPCRVVSVCLSDDWDRRTVARLRGVVPTAWFMPLEAVSGDILRFDYGRILAGARRCLLFWDAHGFSVAECMLGHVLPQIANRPHLVLMHDLSDARYLSPEAAAYGEHGLWKGNDWSGPRLRLGHIDSAVEQAVAIVDFTSRNGIALDSADHSYHTEIAPDARRMAEMQELLGDELFSLGAHWFWFTLNGAQAPLTYPRFSVPDPGARATPMPFLRRAKSALRLLLRGELAP